ncbi:MAG: GNAT family N-acetyltransferase [Promethearchaeota archaeon]
MISDIEVIEEINDGKVYLRKIEKTDSEFFFNNLNKGDLITYLSLGPLKTLEEAKRLIRNYIKYWEHYAQYNYIIEIREPQISKQGSISLWNINWRHDRAEVGIWIKKSNWNKGYGKKALNLIKIVAFNHLKLNRLEAHIATDNQNSIQLFKKCRFEQEGILKRYLNFHGNYHDAVVLGLLKTNI